MDSDIYHLPCRDGRTHLVCIYFSFHQSGWSILVTVSCFDILEWGSLEIKLVGELGVTGGDDRKIGYYAGLIVSAFFHKQR